MHKDIIAALAIAGLLAVAQQPARLANLALGGLVLVVGLSHQNAAAHQQHLNLLRLAITSRTVRQMTAPHIAFSAARTRILRASVGGIPLRTERFRT